MPAGIGFTRERINSGLGKLGDETEPVAVLRFPLRGPPIRQSRILTPDCIRDNPGRPSHGTLARTRGAALPQD